jgi:hypothetical protein
MPPKKTEDSALSWILFVLIWIAMWPLLIVLSIVGRRHLRRLASDRIGENIGSFARAFNRRAEPFDSWVVRATWDALTPYVQLDGRCLALRPTDRLVEDLCIDTDDLDFDLLPEVAARSGHSLDHPESNPHYGRIETVKDLVNFVTRQPPAKS